jgi:hypothetical protein
MPPPMGPTAAPASVNPASQREPSRGGRGRSAHAGGPVYVYRCPVCNKRLGRKTFTATLNSHKKRDGYPCYGHMRIYERTK